jgi:hypothetical protein
MLMRINFLFSVSVLTLLAFAFAGRFVIFKSISAIAPGLTHYFIAAYVLAVLALTALVLARLAIKLGPTASQARTRSASISGYGAQAVFGLAHLSVFFALRTLVEPESADRFWFAWLAAPALYAGGIGLFMADLRRRALRSSD